MTTAERIKRIADKSKLPYGMINNIINSHYGKEAISIEEKLKLLEEEYGIK